MSMKDDIFWALSEYFSSVHGLDVSVRLKDKLDGLTQRIDGLTQRIEDSNSKAEKRDLSTRDQLTQILRILGNVSP